jgi:hypothetical protein
VIFFIFAKGMLWKDPPFIVTKDDNKWGALTHSDGGEKKNTWFTVVGRLQIIKDDKKKTVALTHSQGW